MKENLKKFIPVGYQSKRRENNERTRKEGFGKGDEDKEFHERGFANK